MNAFTAEIVRDAAELARLAPDWWSLWRRAAAATPFQTPAWLIPWWRHYGPGELCTAAVRRGDRLVGLAPFYIEDGAYGRRLLPVGISLSDYHDVLLDPDCAAEAGARLVEAMAAQADGWDAWELEELPPGATAFDLPVPDGCEDNIAPQMACPVLMLPGDAVRALDCVPARKRRKVSLARNRVARRGGARIEEADAATLGPFLERLFALHAARWRSRGEAGLLDDVVRAFQREAAPQLHAAGLLRLYVLRFGDAIVAGYYGLVHGGRAYAYLNGFDPEHEFESPGTIVVAHAVERALAEGCTEFHFLRGRESYKYGWGAVDRWNRKRTFRRIRADG